MTIKEIADTVIRGKKNLVFPLKNHDGWIADSESTHVLDVRGWGHFQYADNDQGGAIQDAFGDWVVKVLNEAYEAEK